MSILSSTFKQMLAANAVPPPGTARVRAPVAADPPNPLLDVFIRNSGRMIHKWLHYFEIYHRTFERYRGRPITFLEIGIENGGSARMWRDYFGPQARIIGVDVNPNCKALEEDGFEVWIGDQGDPAFWSQFLKQHPAVDVVLDDGGHTMRQQVVTFEALFGAVSDGGTYLCEDTHTSYMRLYEGGLRAPNTFHEHVKGLIDEMHAWYYAPLAELAEGAYMAKNIQSICVYDSVVVIEKRLKNPPMALARGYESHAPSPHGLTYLDLRRATGVPDTGAPDLGD